MKRTGFAIILRVIFVFFAIILMAICSVAPLHIPRYMSKAGSTYKPETHTQSTYRFTKLLSTVVSEARMPS